MTLPQEYRFYLQVSIPDQLPRNIEVIDHIFAGLDPRCDLVLIDKKIKNRHFLFEKKGPLLSVKILVADSASFLNNHPMEKDHSYVIDQGDVIEVGKITITLTSSYGDVVSPPERSRLVQFPSLDELSPENEPELKELPLLEEKTNPKKVIRTKKQSQWLIHIKVLSIIVDFFLAYSLMIILGQYILLPIQIFVFFWSMRILIALFLGRTPGEFLLGLRSDTYPLQTRIAPLFFLSFLDQKSENFFFRFMRKWGAVIVFFLCLLSPFFLQGTVQTPVTQIKENAPQLKALQTSTVSGHSLEWGLGLKAEVSVQYFLLPIYNVDKKAALSLFNIDTRKELKLEEIKTFSNLELIKYFHYANPFWKLAEKPLPLKEQVKIALTLSPLNFTSSLNQAGPFFGSSVLLKKEILNLLKTNEDVMIDELSPSLPLLKLSTTSSELVLLFTRDQMIVFSLTQPKPYDLGLDQAFHHSILTQFYWETQDSFLESSEESDILRPLDEMRHGNITALLTYYLNEAKKQSNSNVINQSMGVLYNENKKAILMNALSRLEKTQRDETSALSVEEIKKLLLDSGKTNDRNTSGKKDVRPKSNTRPRKNTRTGKRALQI